MAMKVGGGRGGPTSEINMTPMIDVLLVLLIIFLVIQPTLQRGIEVQVPPVEERTSAAPPPDQIVLTIRPGPTYTLNGLPVDGSRLRDNLASVFRDRPRKVLFVKGDEALVYADVIRAVDAARGAGIEVVGLLPRDARSAAR